MPSYDFEGGALQGFVAGNTDTSLSNTTAAALDGARGLRATRGGAAGTNRVLFPAQAVQAGDVTMTVKLRQSAARNVFIDANQQPGFGYLEPVGGSYIDASALPAGSVVTFTRTFPVAAGYTGLDIEVRQTNANVGDTLDVDTVTIVQAPPPSAAPTVTASTPNPIVTWDDPVPLTASGTGFDTLTWSAPSKPAGSTVTFTGTTSASATYDRDGDYLFRVTATGPGGTATADVAVQVRAAMQLVTANGLAPLKFVIIQ